MSLALNPVFKSLSHRDGIGDFLKARGLTGRAVEVGTLYGAYAEVIVNTWPGHLTCVDPWMNQPDDVYFDGANKLNMSAVLGQVMAKFKGNPRVKLQRMFSLHGSGKFEDGSLDLFYDDGNHAVGHVRADIQAWWPKVKIGGIFGGHDFFTRYDKDTNSDALTAVMELANVLGVAPHVTWCTSWWFEKTEEADRRFRQACIDGTFGQPTYSDNSKLEMVVVMPVAKFDWNLAKKWLAWAEELERRTGEDYPLVAYVTPALSEEQREALEGFAEVVVADGVEELGYFGTPNQMIKGALELVEKKFPGRAMLWVEADAIPIREGWVSEIADEYRACGRPFMGDVYRAESSIPHMTGVAVYHPLWREYAPSLAKLNRDECGWDTLCSHETLPRCHPSKSIQQVWRPPLPITAAWASANIPLSTALFHQVKDGSLIDILAKGLDVEMPALEPALCESTYGKQKHGPIIANGFFAPDPELAQTTATTLGTGVPTVAILIVTFARDMDFLRFCLKSIKRYALGFTGVTIVVPAREKGMYEWARGCTIGYFDEPEGKGMMAHEVQKCYADRWCPNAEAIMHLDADCMLFRPAGPADFMVGGRILSVREPYVDIVNPNRHVWKRCVEDSIGVTPKYDYMVRHPQIHHRDVYERARVLVAGHTGVPFDDYVLGCKNDFPQGFAEFPLLGTVADAEFAHRYHFENYDKAADALSIGQRSEDFQYVYRRNRDRLVEMWSHGGMSRYKSQCEAIAAGRIAEYYVK